MSAPDKHDDDRVQSLMQVIETLPPNAMIGMLGGGQLARMMASSAARLGFGMTCLDPDANAPAAQLCNRHIVAAYDDLSALDELARLCDVVTYEFENVPLTAARHLEQKVALYPPSRALEVAQDRLVEKRFLARHGLPVAEHRAVDQVSDLVDALVEFGGGVLKTRRFGYDGKGQHVFASADAPDAASVFTSIGQGPLILERLVPFTGEFSVIAARGVDGFVVTYQPAANRHENGILKSCVVPAGLSDTKLSAALTMTTTLLDALDYVGVIGVEFFDAPDGIVINEFAPRVHNSGHWTREACAVSQFEQHIRAVTGLALGGTAYHHECEMLNLLGDEALDAPKRYAGQADCHLTLYGKAEARPGRKMGHVTRLIGCSARNS